MGVLITLHYPRFERFQPPFLIWVKRWKPVLDGFAFSLFTYFFCFFFHNYDTLQKTKIGKCLYGSFLQWVVDPPITLKHWQHVLFPSLNDRLGKNRATILVESVTDKSKQISTWNWCKTILSLKTFEIRHKFKTTQSW